MASLLPSQHTIVLVGAVAGAVLVASALVTKRDAWLGALSSHRDAVRRSLLAAVLLVVIALAIGHIDDLAALLRRVRRGDPLWLAVGIGFEVLSFGGYVILTRVVYRPCTARVDLPIATELTLAGVVATRVFSAGGAGGIAFTAWVLHRAGMSGRTAARRLAAFLILLYSVFIAALLLGGVLVITGALPDVPALLGIVALAVGALTTALALLILRIPADLERRVEAMRHQSGRLGRLAARLAPIPQVATLAFRLALSIARERPGVMAAPVMWWAFDVATLWAAFHAFGAAPPVGTIVLAYFLGQLGNLLPLPGGFGGTEGGMLGAFAASGVDAGLALLAIVSYRVLSTYLPAIPGLASYLDLRRRMRSWGTGPEDEGDLALSDNYVVSND